MTSRAEEESYRRDDERRRLEGERLEEERGRLGIRRKDYVDKIYEITSQPSGRWLVVKLMQIAIASMGYEQLQSIVEEISQVRK